MQNGIGIIQTDNHTVSVNAKSYQFLRFFGLVELLHLLKFRLTFARTDPHR